MSSRTPLWPDRRLTSAVVAVLTVLAVQAVAPARRAAAPSGGPPLPVPLPGVAVLPATDPHVTMVVNVGDEAQQVRPESVSVITGGVRQPTTVVPVMSDRMSAAIVV